MGNLHLTSEQYDGRPAVALDLGSSQTMQSAADLHAALKEAVGRAQPLVVDASSVERLATVSVQLLLATWQALAAHDIKMAIRHPSGAFIGALTDLGIDPDGQGWDVMEGGDG